MTVQEVLNTPEFRDEADRMIDDYNNSRRLAQGKYKRTPFDSLSESGEFNTESLIDEFTRIDTGVSDKSATTRKEIARFVIFVAKAAYNKIERARKEADNERK